MNQITIHGRMTKKPELRYTQSQTPVCSFTVAVNDDFDKDKTDFFNCVAWKKTAELIAQYLDKGSETLLNGAMHQRKYTDKNGDEKSAWEITVTHFEFCGSKKETSTVQYTETVEPEVDLPF